jgi:hypothetical protein
VSREASPAVELSKWYLDVATPDGRCAIVYAARLRLLRVSLHVQGVLLLGGKGVRSRWSVLPARAPRMEGTRLAFGSAPLGLHARLDAVDPPFSTRLHDGATGFIDWDCRVPRAEAEVRVGSEIFAGLGYAEQIQITLPSWELPIRELRWGRLLSPACGVVWIEWRGPAPLRLALRNGRPASLSRVGDREVAVDGEVHRLRPVATLRDAPLSGTLPGALRRALPRVGLGLREKKWLARGTVGGAPGLAIHEVVRWP